MIHLANDSRLMPLSLVTEVLGASSARTPVWVGTCAPKSRVSKMCVLCGAARLQPLSQAVVLPAPLAGCRGGGRPRCSDVADFRGFGRRQSEKTIWVIRNIPENKKQKTTMRRT